jgi:serine/threonine protein kinase
MGSTIVKPFTVNVQKNDSSLLSVPKIQLQHQLYKNNAKAHEFEKVFGEYKAHSPRRRLCSDIQKEIDPHDIEIKCKIGEGSVGAVFRGTCRGKNVAIKVIHIKPNQDDILRQFQDEIGILSHINHANICSYMGSCVAIQDQLMIITELYSISLDRILYNQDIHLSIILLTKIANDVIIGLNWLHHIQPHKIIHSDLKAANILLDENYRAVIGDFGQSRMLRGDKLIDVCGSPIYMAPEQHLGIGSDESADIYSYGILLWEMIHRRIAYHKYLKNTPGIIGQFIENVCEHDERPTIRNECPQDLAKLMRQCWVKNPAERLKSREILPIIQSIIARETIPDEDGRKFWSSNFGEADLISWQDFKVALKTQTGAKSLFWVKPFMVTGYAVHTSIQARTSDRPTSALYEVSAEKFGHILQRFGPFVDFVNNIQHITLCEWFHGDVSSKIAEKLFRYYHNRVGSFLIRFSGYHHDGFVLNYISIEQPNMLRTVRIKNCHHDGVECLGLYYVSLQALVEQLTEELNLMYPIKSNQHVLMMERWKIKSGSPKFIQVVNGTSEETTITPRGGFIPNRGLLLTLSLTSSYNKRINARKLEVDPGNNLDTLERSAVNTPRYDLRCAERDAKRDATRDARRDATRDATRDTTRDAMRDSIRDVPRDIDRDDARDVPRDIDRDDARDVPRDIDRDNDRDVSRDIDRDDARDTERDAGRDINRDAGRDINRDAGRDINRDAGRDINIDASGDIHISPL